MTGVQTCALPICMILPTIIVASEEALKAVPKTFREGSIALGATHWETIYKNVQIGRASCRERV